jgi:quercetin dioxygenase-like cupin family protein
MDVVSVGRLLSCLTNHGLLTSGAVIRIRAANGPLVVTATLAALYGGLPLPGVGATPPDGDITRTDIARGDTLAPVSINTDGNATLLVQGLRLGPSASSGWHTHPGPEVSAITIGTVVLQTATECVPVNYGAGQAVFIPAGVPHLVANEAGQDAHVVVTYTLPVNAPVRGDSPDVCAK